MSKLLCVATFACLLFNASARAEAASVTLAWDPNSEPDLAGYIVLVGTQSGRYDRVIEVGKTTIWTFGQAENGQTYYFVVQAVNTGGERSEFSAEVWITVDEPDGPASPEENPDPVDQDPGGEQESGPPGSVRLALSRTAVSFGAIAGTNGLRSAAQQAAVTFSNGSSTWIAKTNAPWLQIPDNSGNGAGAFTMSVKDGTYTPGTLTGTITVSAPNATNAPRTIPVTLRVVGIRQRTNRCARHTSRQHHRRDRRHRGDRLGHRRHRRQGSSHLS